MSSQVRSDEGEWAVNSGAKISPILVEPKKAVVEAAQTTCLDSGSQSVPAIRCLSTSRRGKVTTLLVLLGGEDRARWAAPRSRRARVGSSEICWQDNPFK